jgi:hypothetical protein
MPSSKAIEKDKKVVKHHYLNYHLYIRIFSYELINFQHYKGNSEKDDNGNIESIT